MDKIELKVIDLLEYLQEMIETSPKVPITGKVMIDKNEFLEVVDQITNYLPEQFKKAQWVVSEREKLLSDAQKQYENARRESVEMLKYNVDNHEVVKEAKKKANEIVALAQQDAKAIRIGSREYSAEILHEMDREIELKKMELIKSMQEAFENVANEIDENLTQTGRKIKENISELQNM